MIAIIWLATLHIYCCRLCVAYNEAVYAVVNNMVATSLHFPNVFEEDFYNCYKNSGKQMTGHLH